MTNHNLLQARILHLSDLHFGRGHRFSPPLAPSGPPGASRGYLTLAKSVADDLAGPDFSDPIWHGDARHRNPLLVAVSGDLTQTGTSKELSDAGKCIKELCEASPLSTALNVRDVALVPGNHDLLYDKVDPVERWSVYCAFDSSLRSRLAVPPERAYELSQVHYRQKDALIVAEINSAFDVQKDTDETHRGQVDEGVLSKLNRELEDIPAFERQRCLKVAVVHHHPVVLPFFAEAARGYDAILGATKLLQLLRDNGFHLVLHGHKHFPHTFSYDPQCAWTQDPRHGIFVVAGGSAGASAADLPAERNATNTYNVIALKWNPDGRHGRVRVVTRGLQTRDAGGRELIAAQWHWTTLKIDDRLLGVQQPVSTGSFTKRPYSDELDAEFNAARREHYTRLRGNMVVVDVIPSLHPGQGYEATGYLVTHNSRKRPAELPVKVEWSPGPAFESVKVCTEPPFAVRFSYWAPAMLQARMHFRDGTVEAYEVYAHTYGLPTRDVTTATP